MKYPVEPSPFAAFTLANFDLWVRTHNPAQIELSDKQYAWLTNLMRECIKNYRGIPIVFLGAQRRRLIY